jgi:2-dehydro-3-deoxygluconokinase
MLLTFGEIMLRLCPEGFSRLKQAMPGRLEASFAGAEANAAAVSALLGKPARFATALPDNPLSDCVEASLRALGLDVSCVMRTRSGRLGVFFCETGANQRASQVVYDREASAIAVTPPSAYVYDALLDGATWLHTTGITPSLSENAYESALELCKRAKARKTPVSIDLNFRKKLWNWEKGTKPQALAERCMAKLVKYADLLIANEEDASDVFGVKAAEGAFGPELYRSVAAQLFERFPNLSSCAFTLRDSVSATHNRWGAVLIRKDGQSHFAPCDASGAYQPYEITSIVDRVGAGDSFAGSLIYALMSEKYKEPSAAIRFAAAASCLKHSIKNDFALMTEAEIVALMNGSGSGRIQR